MECLVAVLFGIVAIYLAVIVRALLQRRDRNMRAPVLESFADFRCSDLVVQASQRQNSDMIATETKFYIFPYYLLFLFILSIYFVLYILISDDYIPEEVEPLQCTGSGNGAAVMRGKNYPPPND